MQVARRIWCTLPGSKLCFPEQYDLSVLYWSLFQAEARTSVHKVEKKQK